MITFNKNELTIADMETLNNIATDCNKDIILIYGLNTIKINIVKR